MSAHRINGPVVPSALASLDASRLPGLLTALANVGWEKRLSGLLIQLPSDIKRQVEAAAELRGLKWVRSLT